MSLSTNPIATVVSSALISPVSSPTSGAAGGGIAPSTHGVAGAQAAAQRSGLATDTVPSELKSPLLDPKKMRENLDAALAKLNEQVERNGRGINFTLDERLNRAIITVRNTSTGEVVRQIPTEVIINLAHSIEDIKGLLADHLL
jgi:flagellar protein FlaG